MARTAHYAEHAFLGTPRGIQFADVFRQLEQINGVKKVHNLRVWALTLDKASIIDCHFYANHYRTTVIIGSHFCSLEHRRARQCTERAKRCLTDARTPVRSLREYHPTAYEKLT